MAKELEDPPSMWDLWIPGVPDYQLPPGPAPGTAGIWGLRHQIDFLSENV